MVTQKSVLDTFDESSIFETFRNPEPRRKGRLRTQAQGGAVRIRARRTAADTRYIDPHGLVKKFNEANPLAAIQQGDVRPWPRCGCWRGLPGGRSTVCGGLRGVVEW